MTIILGCDSFLSLRNVRISGLIEHLGNAPVVALVDPNQLAGARQVAPPGVELGSLIEFKPQADPALLALMNRAYWARKCHYDPGTIWHDFRAMSFRAYPADRGRRTASLLKGRARLLAFGLAGRAGYARRWRRDFMVALRQHPVVADYERLLTDLGATLVVLFSLEGNREMALGEAACKLGLPVVVVIRSRDNLAAKIQHIPDAQAVAVWSATMRGYFRHLYPDLAAAVHVTGALQFDRHLDPAYRLPRDEFFARLGLDPARPLVVYTCATPYLIPDEKYIVQHLADAVRDGALARHAQLLVRGHPRGFGSNVQWLEQPRPGVVVYPPPGDHPYGSAGHEEQVVRLILEDEPVHLATLAYQDVQVNVGGTMIVDSAIFDKPSIGVYYNVPSDVPDALSVRRFYARTDMKTLIRAGGLRLAGSPGECISLINQFLQDPQLDAQGRRRIRDMECGPLDGQAGHRLAAILRENLPT